jgi:hypothetical protein
MKKEGIRHVRIRQMLSVWYPVRIQTTSPGCPSNAVALSLAVKSGEIFGAVELG